MRRKILKKLAVAIAAVIAFIALALHLLGLYWSGAFNRFMPREIARYESPDGQYVLEFDQLGDPDWPFGPTDIRLTLQDAAGKKLDSLDTSIQDDGANASAYNIKSLAWAEDGVTVILCASEMEDMTVTLACR